MIVGHLLFTLDFDLTGEKVESLEIILILRYKYWQLFERGEGGLFFRLPCQKAKTKKATWLKANRKKA